MPSVNSTAGELWIGKTAITLDDAEWLADVLLDEYGAAWGKRGSHVQRQAIASRHDAVVSALRTARNWRRASGCVGGRV